jgi:hypothetical protein
MKEKYKLISLSLLCLWGINAGEMYALGPRNRNSRRSANKAESRKTSVAKGNVAKGEQRSPSSPSNLSSKNNQDLINEIKEPYRKMVIECGNDRLKLLSVVAGLTNELEALRSKNGQLQSEIDRKAPNAPKT